MNEEGFLILSGLYRKASRSVTSEGVIGKELMTENQMGSLLDGLKFLTLHWEDRTADLKNLAAHLVMDFDVARQKRLPYDQFFCAGSDLRFDIRYYLLIAKKWKW
jgi:hypothetical protein